MKPGLFISYSRRQTPFVDRFVSKLQQNGYSYWLDYQCLVPAQHWKKQILDGIKEADIFLLVVSRDSMNSKNVEPEWKYALDLDKPIVLLIFEAVQLPPELQNCSWVDFRVHYKKGFQQLESLLDEITSSSAVPPLKHGSVQQESPAPQSGFRAPARVWLALILSLIVIIGSVPTWWTVLIPFILIPLPRQIYNRNYIFGRVVPALVSLPFLLFITDVIFMAGRGSILYGLRPFYQIWATPTGFASLALLGLLLTPVMQRRARPEAARVRFANPLNVEGQKPGSVPFFIDSAPEDSRYAEDLRRVLEKYGHRLVGENENPQAIFTLLSTYKKKTDYDPNHEAVYPLLVQNIPDHEIESTLGHIQRIDLRNGIQNVDKLAEPLPEPQSLLKALAIPPVGSQEVFPLPVNALQFFYLILGIMSGGILLTTILSVGMVAYQASILWNNLAIFIFMILNGLLLFGAVMYSVRGLRTRRGGSASIYPLVILTLFQAVIVLFISFLAMDFSQGASQELSDLLYSSDNSLLMFVVFLLGSIIVLPILLVRRRELHRWFPRLQKYSVSRLENMLLLYPPANGRALLFHLIFHGILLMVYLYLTFAYKDLLHDSTLACLGLILISFLWGSHRLAKRFSA